MTLEVGAAAEVADDVEVVGVPVAATSDGPRLAVEPSAGLASLGVTGQPDRAWCERHGFAGKVGQVLWWRLRTAPTAGDEGSGPEVALVGTGDEDDRRGDRGRESARRAAAAFVRATGQTAFGALLLAAGATGGGDAADLAAALCEGAVLGAYHFGAYRTGDPPPALARLVVVAAGHGDLAGVAAGARRGARVAESVCLARDLVNEPPSSLTPDRFATRSVERFASVPEVSVEVWDEERIAAERLGGLLGVARGSVQPPRLVRAEYRPAATPRGHVALVGKGITFDSGGLSLKTAGGMETMKTDMSGAAAVVAALDAAVALEVPVRITAVTPLTENMPSGSATKPGDVLTTRSGRTIEVLNTDAEGRLVLADGLTLAVEAEPDAIVDLATLTGAQVVALGKDVAALFGTDEGLVERVRRAGERAGEPLWPMPLPADYRSHIDSEVADLRNTGRAGQAGSIAAALLLREFVGTVPWAHVDMAGPARADEAARYLSKGGTGFGVRTLVALLTDGEALEALAADPAGATDR